MTRDEFKGILDEEFLGALDKEGYSYEIEGDKIVITHKGDVNLEYLKEIPSDVEFSDNVGYVGLMHLETLPPDVVFNNKGSIGLEYLKTIHPGVEFNNRGHVYLWGLLQRWFSAWEGNIGGIRSNKLLNLMISKGVFI